MFNQNYLLDETLVIQKNALEKKKNHPDNCKGSGYHRTGDLCSHPRMESPPWTPTVHDWVPEEPVTQREPSFPQQCLQPASQGLGPQRLPAGLHCRGLKNSDPPEGASLARQDGRGGLEREKMGSGSLWFPKRGRH